MIYQLYGYKKEFYNYILKIAFEYCNAFSITVYKYIHKKDLSDNYYSFMQAIKPYELDKWDYVLPSYQVAKQQYHIYKLCDSTQEMISKTHSFVDWKSPELPFDLSFYYSKHAFIWYITMENLLFIDTNDSAIIDRIKEIGFTLVPC